MRCAAHRTLTWRGGRLISETAAEVPRPNEGDRMTAQVPRPAAHRGRRPRAFSPGWHRWFRGAVMAGPGGCQLIQRLGGRDRMAETAAVKTNVRGTLPVLEAAQAGGAESFVNISTGKAADPGCVLGYSKGITERLTADMPSRAATGTCLSVRSATSSAAGVPCIPTARQTN